MHLVQKKRCKASCCVTIIPSLGKQGIHESNDAWVEQGNSILREESHERITQLEAEFVETPRKVMCSDTYTLHLLLNFFGLKELYSYRFRLLYD